jgi:hypothetical protein
MAQNPYTLCSAALLLVGANTIQSFEDETREAEVCAIHYPIVRDALLAEYPWRFCHAMRSLNQMVDTPLANWAYAYTLPDDCVVVRGVTDNSPYELIGPHLYSDNSQVNLIYQFLPDERKFPVKFNQVLVYELAVVLSPSLRDSASGMDKYKSMAELEKRKARSMDSQSQPPSGLSEQVWSLITARYTGG